MSAYEAAPEERTALMGHYALVVSRQVTYAARDFRRGCGGGALGGFSFDSEDHVRHAPRRFVLLAVWLAVLTLAGTRAISAASICVNTSGTGGCFTSINAAIAAAAPGDIIRIAEGRYIENVVINKSVTLAGSDDDVVIMPAVSSPECAGDSLCGGLASNIVLVQADNVTIRNLTLDGDNPDLTSGIIRDHHDLDARNGIITNRDAGVYTNLTVYNVTVKNVYLRGMYASSGGTFNFHDNTVTNVQGDASSIAMFNRGGSGRMVHNKVSKANDAISSNHSSGTQFLDNDIRASGSGVHTDNAGDGGGTGDVIRGNRVSDGMPGAYGIFVFVPYMPVTVANNDVSGVEVGLSAFAGAFASAPTVTSIFTDNDVKGRRTAGSVGVLVTTESLGYGQTDVAANFTGNTVSDFENGFMIQADTGHVVSVNASCNTILRSTTRGVVAGGIVPLTASYPGLPTAGGGTQHVTFSKNNINGKPVGMSNIGSGVIDASRNWWGCAGGPNSPGCGSVTSMVDFSPYLTQPAACARNSGDRDDK